MNRCNRAEFNTALPRSEHIDKTLHSRAAKHFPLKEQQEYSVSGPVSRQHQLCTLPTCHSPCIVGRNKLQQRCQLLPA